MNENTLKRLQSNPHYKMSANQTAELASATKKPMVEFGSFEPHSNNLPIHDVGQTLNRRTKRK